MNTQAQNYTSLLSRDHCVDFLQQSLIGCGSTESEFEVIPRGGLKNGALAHELSFCVRSKPLNVVLATGSAKFYPFFCYTLIESYDKKDILEKRFQREYALFMQDLIRKQGNGGETLSQTYANEYNEQCEFLRTVEIKNSSGKYVKRDFQIRQVYEKI